MQWDRCVISPVLWNRFGVKETVLLTESCTIYLNSNPCAMGDLVLCESVSPSGVGLRANVAYGQKGKTAHRVQEEEIQS